MAFVSVVFAEDAAFLVDDLVLLINQGLQKMSARCDVGEAWPIFNHHQSKPRRVVGGAAQSGSCHPIPESEPASESPGGITSVVLRRTPEFCKKVDKHTSKIPKKKAPESGASLRRLLLLFHRRGCCMPG
jgi:hypothetical protein